jgi:O-antigen ligase
MRSFHAHAEKGRTTVTLAVLTILPAVAFILIRLLGLQSLVKMAVMAAIALAVGLVFFLRPKYGVYFMVFYVSAGLNFYFGGTFVAMGVMALILGGTVIMLLRGQEWQGVDGLFLWSVAFFGLIAFQSILWAYDIPRSLKYYSMFLKALALVFLIVQVVRTPDDLKWFGRWIFIGGVATVLLGVLNWKLGLGKYIGGGIVLRFSGAYKNPNYAAAYMNLVIPLGVFAIRNAKTLYGRLISVLGVVTLIIGVFFTYSRSGLFAFAFVVLAVLVREVRSRKAYGAAFAVLLIGILLSPRYYWSHVWTVTQIMEEVQHDWSLYNRMMAAREAWETFKQHPLTGVGLRNFIVHGADVLYLRIGAHNMHLEVLSGLGLIGYFVFLSIYYTAARQCVRGMKGRWREQESWIRDIAYYFLVALLSTFISGVFADFEFDYLVWIPIAGTMVIANLTNKLTRQ